jgi:FkbM family methyltransferase
MIQHLFNLRKLGYVPDTILDIGACLGEWTNMCRGVYPDASFYLFEPIAYPELERVKQHMPRTIVFHALLDDTTRDVDWYEKRNTGDSMFRERTPNYKDCVPVKKTTIPLHELIDPYLPLMNRVMIKIDRQGAEIPILRGAGDILQKTDFILLEIPFFGQYNEGVPGFLEHIRYMDEIGYVPFDLLDHHYVKDYLIQVDVLFVSKRHPLNKQVQEDLIK